MRNGVIHACVKSFLVWLIAVGAVAAVGFEFFQRGSTEMGLIMLGLIFAGYCVATRTVARRGKDATTLLMVGAGGTFGFWFPPLYELFAQIVVTWAETGVLPADLAGRFALPVALGVSGLMMAAVLYAGTSSGGVFMLTVLVSGVAAGTPIFQHLLGPYEPWGMFGAMVLWHAAVAGMLASWAVRQAKEHRAASCPHCGKDLGQIAIAICPSCKKRLPGAGVLHTIAEAQESRRAA
ncbi:MAG: hypothetical protein EA378_11275 [Phycisphaerales bacterium]|nr:MAG: hypothetical protein EA378_11275 [Phycisphaerales bacterium]